MKTLFTCLATLFTVICFSQNTTAPLNAQQILRLVIQHYDPDQRWEQFHGQMHLNTIHPTGNSSEEDLVLDNSRDLYQSTLFGGGQIIERKLNKGKASFSLNGRAELTQEEVEKYQLNMEGVYQISQHHQVHFGLPMYLKSLDIPLELKPKRAIFNQIDCWVLTVLGDAEMKTGSYFRYPIHLYVNPNGFSLVGIKYDNPSGEMPASYVLFNDEIEVDGIRIPKIKTYYLAEDDSYWFTDVFSTFTRGIYLGAEIEKEAILQLLEEETRYFYVRDYEAWAKCWSHQEDVFFSYCSKTDYTRKNGWVALSDHMRNYMQDNPDPHLPPIERSDYVFHLQGDLAWVYFKNREGDTSGQHQRVLRKENGTWKMVNMTGIDEASYQER